MYHPQKFFDLFTAVDWSVDHGGFGMTGVVLLKDIGSFPAGTAFDFATSRIWDESYVCFYRFDENQREQELLRVELSVQVQVTKERKTG